MINTRAGPEAKLNWGIYSQESRAALEGALAFVAQCPWKALTVLTEQEAEWGSANSHPLPQSSTAQNTAQHSSPPPKNTLCSSQHCSLSRAAAPGEFSVRKCKIAVAQTGPRHTASCPARVSNPLTAPAASRTSSLSTKHY